MSKISLKDLVEEESVKTKKIDSGWTPIEIPLQEKSEPESLVYKPRKGIRSLIELNQHENKETKKINSGWKPIEIPLLEKKTEHITYKPREGIKSLTDLNEDIKPSKIETEVELTIPTSRETIQPIHEQITNIVENEEVVNEKVLIPFENNNLIVEENIKEEIKQEKEKPKVLSMAERVSEFISKEVKLEEKDSYQQPDAPLTNGSVKDIRKKIKFLEDWIAKISLTGPGGGAGDVINLDHPVKLITANYTFTRKDYYVGVNATSSITITIPDTIGFPGRMVIIKDESGNCSNNPITVDCTVDNDTGGFILAQNNGGIQMIYREGWRIV